MKAVFVLKGWWRTS
ncbi:TPA: trp operon leader peptide [Escherichia coli]